MARVNVVNTLTEAERFNFLLVLSIVCCKIMPCAALFPVNRK